MTLLGAGFLGVVAMFAFLLFRAYVQARVENGEIFQQFKQEKDKNDALSQAREQDAIVNGNTDFDSMSKKLDAALRDKLNS